MSKEAIIAAVRAWPRGTPHREAARAARELAEKSPDKPDPLAAGYDAGVAVMLEQAKIPAGARELVARAIELFGRGKIWIEEPHEQRPHSPAT